MQVTMDKAGRIVIPLAIRNQLGFVPGPVDLIVDGAGLRIEVETHGRVVHENGRVVIASDESFPFSEEEFREFRLADQR